MASSGEYSTNMVAHQFVNQYYEAMINTPDKLHFFYGSDSVALALDQEHQCENNPRLLHGQEGIRQYIQHAAALAFADKVEFDAIDFEDVAASEHGGVLVLVTGCGLTRGLAQPRRFSHTFVLGKQDQGFYVQNDILRFTDAAVKLEAEEQPIVQQEAVIVVQEQESVAVAVVVVAEEPVIVVQEPEIVVSVQPKQQQPQQQPKRAKKERKRGGSKKQKPIQEEQPQQQEEDTVVVAAVEAPKSWADLATRKKLAPVVVEQNTRQAPAPKQHSVRETGHATDKAQMPYTRPNNASNNNNGNTTSNNANKPKTNGAQPVKQEPFEQSIYVSGLPSSVTEEDLRQSYSAVGKVLNIKLTQSRQADRSWAYIKFATTQLAINACDYELEIDGKAIRAEAKRPPAVRVERAQQPRGAGRGRGGRGGSSRGSFRGGNAGFRGGRGGGRSNGPRGETKK